MFHCREKELKELNKRYHKGYFECIVIYGRRRVGKTALINEFCKDKKTIFLSALNASAQENLEALSKAIYAKDHLEVNDVPVYTSFDAAFAEITRQAQKERTIFVIDEYPYLAKADESISSRLQHIIDHTWKNTHLFLILCGSSMSFMENQVLGYESPLYGRRTGQFKIQALDYKEMTAFNPDLKEEQQSLVYGITGGIPHYINKLNVEEDVDEALKNNFFNTSSYLFEEPENLLKQELREPAVYNSVITAVAGGASRLNEISTKVGLESAICSKYLKVLLDLGIIKKETPITEKNSKKTIKRHFSDYMGLIFEQMCKEYLLRYAENLPIVLSDIGQWWGTDAKEKKEVQIDIVGTPVEGNEYIIGSCKYKNEAVGIFELELMKQYAKVFGKGEKYHYYIFSKGGFTKGMEEIAIKENVILLTLRDIYMTD